MISCPRYLRSVPDENQDATSQSEKVDDGKKRMESFLPDVQCVQELKQHHVHPMNSETGERELVTGCRRKDNPDLCKGDYPRTQRLIDRAVVLCPGLLRSLAMPFQGRRNKIGAMHGPMNHAYLNGTHPALLVAMRFNSDVQLPYRLPISAQTHANLSLIHISEPTRPY